MKIEEAISILKQHNEWRRGAEIPMVDPTDLGEAINLACGALNPSDSCNSTKNLQENANPWHRVADGDLPKVDKYQKCIKVFVRKGNDVYVAFFSPIAGFCLSSSFYTEYMLNDIDYWMEIPEIKED